MIATYISSFFGQVIQDWSWRGFWMPNFFIGFWHNYMGLPRDWVYPGTMFGKNHNFGVYWTWIYCIESNDRNQIWGWTPIPENGSLCAEMPETPQKPCVKEQFVLNALRFKAQLLLPMSCVAPNYLPIYSWLVIWNIFFPYIGNNNPNSDELHHFSEG